MNHDVITFGLPILAILAGILFGRSDLKDFRTEINARLDRVEGQLDRIDGDLRSFYQVTGKWRGAWKPLNGNKRQSVQRPTLVASAFVFATA